MSVCKVHKYTIDEEYPDLVGNSTPMAQVLSKTMYSKHKDVKTSFGFTFDDVIQLGIDVPDHLTGVVLGDENTYDMFKSFFDPVIELVHNHQVGPKQVVDLDEGKLYDALDQEERLDLTYVTSVSMRGCRNIKGFPLGPLIDRKQRRQVEKVVVECLRSLPKQFQGTYYPFGQLSNEAINELKSDGIQLDRPHGLHTYSMGLCKDWPDARGVWLSKSKNFTVWVNVKDHVRISVFGSDGDAKQLLCNYRRALEEFNAALASRGYEVMWHDQLGYISQDLGDIGLSLRISVHCKLPLLGRRVRHLDDATSILKLVKKGTNDNTLFDISNQARIGCTEVEVTSTVFSGVKTLLRMEKTLAQNQPIDKILEELSSPNAAKTKGGGAGNKVKKSPTLNPPGKTGSLDQTSDFIVLMDDASLAQGSKVTEDIPGLQEEV